MLSGPNLMWITDWRREPLHSQSTASL